MNVDRAFRSPLAQAPGDSENFAEQPADGCCVEESTSRRRTHQPRYYIMRVSPRAGAASGSSPSPSCVIPCAQDHGLLKGSAACEKHAERSKPVVSARRTPRVLTSRHGSGRTFPAFGSFPRVGRAMIPARTGWRRTHLEKTLGDERGSRGVVGLSTAQDRR